MSNIKPVIFRGKKLEGYFVSDQGIVYKNYKVIFGRRISTDYIPLKGSKSTKKTEVKLTFPEDLFEYKYTSRHDNGNSQLNIAVHKIVMETFRPIYEYPPDRLVDVWPDIPDKAKEWIDQTIVINHINHNPHDNRLENLEYVTPQENTHKAIKFYGKNGKKDKNKNIVNLNQNTIKISAFYD